MKFNFCGRLESGRVQKKNEKITEPYYSISSANYDSHMNFVGLT